jgi:hypothetical protein
MRRGFFFNGQSRQAILSGNSSAFRLRPAVRRSTSCSTSRTLFSRGVATRLAKSAAPSASFWNRDTSAAADAPELR